MKTKRRNEESEAYELTRPKGKGIEWTDFAECGYNSPMWLWIGEFKIDDIEYNVGVTIITSGKVISHSEWIIDKIERGIDGKKPQRTQVAHFTTDGNTYDFEKIVEKVRKEADK